MRIFYLIYCLICFFTASERLIAETTQPEEPTEMQLPIYVESFGCLLPLSGEYQELGEKALRGALLATETMAPGTEFRVLVDDTGSNQKSLLSSINNIYRHKDLSFLVGPFPSKFINSVKPLIWSKKVPALVFPVSENENVGGPYVVKFYYSLEDQVRVVSEYATKDLGVRNFAVLYPKSRYGRQMKDIFTTRANRLGARVIYESSYDPDTKDISKELKWIESAKPDAIFIPDGAASSARIVLTLMHGTDMKEILFLGPSTWNSPLFLNLVGNEIDGFVYRAIFTDFFSYDSSEWGGFRDKFKAKYNLDPSFLEYQVFSAVRLVLSIIQDRKLSGEEIINALYELRHNNQYEVKKDSSGSLQISPIFRILSVEDGEVIDVVRVKRQ